MSSIRKHPPTTILWVLFPISTAMMKQSVHLEEYVKVTQKSSREQRDRRCPPRKGNFIGGRSPIPQAQVLEVWIRFGRSPQITSPSVTHRLENREITVCFFQI